MANLIENMIAYIFPTMKLQITFMQRLEKLKESSQLLINSSSIKEPVNGPFTSTAVSKNSFKYCFLLCTLNNINNIMCAHFLL